MFTNQELAEKDLGHSLNNYHSVTINELLAMNNDDYETLITLFYEENEYQFADVGIYEVEPLVNQGPWFIIGWSAYSGDPSVAVKSLDAPIEYESWGGEWYYTLLAPNQK